LSFAFTGAGHRLRGITFYLVALFLFTVLDTSAKYAARSVPAMEVTWVRFVGHAVLALLFLRPWQNLALYRSRRPVLQFLRSVLLFGSTIFNFLALTHLQMAETISIGFGSAFVVAGLAGPVLGEWIGPRRWIAIVVGFLGVIVVTRPGPAGVDPAVFFSVGSLCCNSGYLLLTRLLAPSESAGSMLLFPAIAATVLLAPFAVPIAVLPPNPLVAFALVMTGICGAVGHWFLIEAHRRAPAGVLAPFVYSGLIWMIGLGYLVFDDVPHEFTILGAAIVIGSGLYILYRERVRGGAETRQA
jgi:drug/metabolite transporter (DMT)-like permease